jgi:hypothetical protein
MRSGPSATPQEFLWRLGASVRTHMPPQSPRPRHRIRPRRPTRRRQLLTHPAAAQRRVMAQLPLAATVLRQPATGPLPAEHPPAAMVQPPVARAARRPRPQPQPAAAGRRRALPAETGRPVARLPGILAEPEPAAAPVLIMSRLPRATERPRPRAAMKPRRRTAAAFAPAPMARAATFMMPAATWIFITG